MDNTERLIELFKEFPGIGPRQAKRFVYFLLNKNSSYSSSLSTLIKEVRNTVHNCDNCFRFFPKDRGLTCPICLDLNRDKTIMIVSNDVDFENIEKTKYYKGYYFILGGTVPILEKEPEKRVRQNELIEILNKRKNEGVKEIILAMNYTPEGENTSSHIHSLIESKFGEGVFKISTLGRGLSSGTELEYSDGETIKNALRNRQ